MTGAEIRKQRIAKKISQRLLAAYAGIDPAKLNRMERREEPVTETAQRRIEEGLLVIPLMQHKEIVDLKNRVLETTQNR